ncbi:hypothetical protein [Chelativorans sp. AA-79]|uniref:hypothetical protein n=1 Tax=Chelativorans sp. AA-79 TaxID=3028735 RepID=UPI0023F88F19|nr:hypothetical protein [Chelativorans sp. AA-79]WEX07194.1 hypothetical protein PVE73_13705 [Chelativorans sp. AA-79]
MVNSDHIVWFDAQPSGSFTELHVTYYGGDRNIAILVKEPVEEIAAMLTRPPS